MTEFQHRTRPEVKQVKFSSWSDNNAPRSYWKDVETLAFFLGKALDGRTYVERNVNSISTIRVQQTKEKFGDAIVYCSLADPELVTRAWEKSSKFIPGDVPASFKLERTIEDARHYRNVYQRMMQLVPQYYVVIRNGASYPGLICETKEELDELLGSPYYMNSGFDIKDPEQRKALYEVCGF